MAKKPVVFLTGNLPEDDKAEIIKRISASDSKYFPAIVDYSFVFSDSEEIKHLEGYPGHKEFTKKAREKLSREIGKIKFSLYAYSKDREPVSRNSDKFIFSIGDWELKAKLVSETDFGGLFLYTYEFVGKPTLYKERIVNFD